MDGGQNTNGGINSAVGTGNPVVGGNNGVVSGGATNVASDSGLATGGVEALGNPVKSAPLAPQGGGLSW